jgi:signal transduction histidine kinase
MSAGTEHPHTQVMEEVGLADLVQCALESFARDMPSATLAVYRYNQDLRDVALVAATHDHPHEQTHDVVQQFCTGGSLSSTVDGSQFPGLGVTSAQFLLFKIGDEPIGALLLLSRGKTAKKSLYPHLQLCFATIRGLLQNEYRGHSLAISDTIQAIAHQVGEGVSPQELVNIVSERLLDSQIRFCALLLYGPRREDRPNGPFAYLDLQGSWSNRLGSGVGVGMHLYLDQYTEMMQEIEDRKIWHIPDVRAVENRFDSLTRGFIRNADVHSIVIIALESVGRRLGMMIMGTEANREFTQAELRSYQAVSEFLALRAMANLLKQEQDFVQRGRAALLDAVNDSVLMVLPSAGSVTGDSSKTTVLTINKAFTTLFGVSSMRAQGLSLPQLLNKMQLPEDVRQNLSYHWLSTTVRDPGTQRGDFAMIHPTGYHTSIGWYSAPVLRDNKVMGRIYIFHDVTDDRTAISLRANFVSRMSHELRTPLTSIKGFAQYMLEELNDSLTPSVRDYVEIILDNARLLNTLFSDIIEITRADIGDLKLLIGAAQLPDLVEHVVLGFEDQGIKERKWIETQIADDLPTMQMDTGHISRVLSLLLSNAFQHAPVDTAIRVSAQEMRSSGELPFSAPSDVILPSILVTVEDQGDGIAAEDTELIFQPFYRTRDARAARLEGSGLGLALARSILTLHRGKIWAEARRRGRRGARIFFTLPISAE